MASDLISREALKDEMVKDLASTMRMTEMHKGDMALRVLNKIDEAPAVERKAKLLKNVCIKKKTCQGYKMREGYYMQPYTCSHCLKSIPEDSEYCMYCGCELVKEKDND